MFNQRITRIVLVATLLIAGNLFSAEKKLYKIGSVSWIGWSGLHVAEAKGFWKEQGIDVLVHNYVDGDRQAEHFKSGVLDINWDLLATGASQYTEENPIVILTETNWSHGGDKIILKKDVKISELKGEMFGTYVNTFGTSYFFNQYLKENSMKLSDFDIKGLDETMLNQFFIKGNLKVILTWEPHASKAAQKGDGIIVATTATYPGCMPEGMMMMKKRHKTFPKDVLKKIIIGYIKAVEWSKKAENWKEYQKILNTKTFNTDPDFSEKELKEMLNGVKIHNSKEILERNISKNGTKLFLENFKVFLKEQKALKSDFKVEKLFDNSILLEALKEYDKK